VKTPFLVGDSIYLRPLELESGPAAARWLGAAEIDGPFARNLPVSDEGARRLIEALTRDERQIGIGVARRADDRLVGVVRLHGVATQRRSAGYRLALAPAAELGRGAADAVTRETTRLVLAYAFEVLNLNRIHLRLLAADRAARKRWASEGFVEEGILRQEALRDGAYEDVVVMAILRGEWDQRLATTSRRSARGTATARRPRRARSR